MPETPAAESEALKAKPTFSSNGNEDLEPCELEICMPEEEYLPPLIVKQDHKRI